MTVRIKLPLNVLQALTEDKYLEIQAEAEALFGKPAEEPPTVTTVEGSPEEVLAKMAAGEPINECSMAPEYNAVEPPHYTRGVSLHLGALTEDKHDIDKLMDAIRWARNLDVLDMHLYAPVNAIDIMRCIQDPRLATAFKYIWRLAFGGKREPGDNRPQREIDRRDAESAAWYLKDFANNIPVYHHG